MKPLQYERGQTVAFSVRVTPEMSKLHLAEVIDLGGRGVRVRCVDGGRELWLRASEVRPVSSEAPPETEAVRSREPRGAAVPEALGAAKKPAETPLAEPREATSSVDALESQGIDPMAAWLSLGRELIGRAARDVDRAEADVARADGDVANAKALLAEMESLAVAARDRLRAAAARRAEIERRTGEVGQ